MLEVVCAIIIRDHQVLLCQRAPGKHLAGSWEFPGGKVEEDEEAVAALQREIREELACSIEVGEALPALEHHYPALSLRLQAFPCRLAPSSPEPRALEHAAIRWMPLQEVETLELAGADRRLWNQLRDVIGSISP
ncbi:MAG: (deoxy)nucleoside triphosphate pyrophosphohydrolase [Roseibacillus sp.]|nr:(deoxy)nucleoside triphosphate pyrophosphohydrolase [Roseibacillus sp.]